MVVLDRRLRSKRYGEAFLRSLPPCDLRELPLRDLAGEVSQWLARARRQRALVNVALRALERDDVAWVDTWLGPVAASAGYGEIDAAAPGTWLDARSRKDRGLHPRVIERDGERAGVLVYRVHAPRRGAAIIEIVATPPNMARRGAGMAAAALVEAELRAAGVRAVYAPAPAVHGIDVYFWIRLGYRPLQSAEWPCTREGVAWLRRAL